MQPLQWASFTATIEFTVALSLVSVGHSIAMKNLQVFCFCCGAVSSCNSKSRNESSLSCGRAMLQVAGSLRQHTGASC
jgi:hypothetical protein